MIAKVLETNEPQLESDCSTIALNRAYDATGQARPASDQQLAFTASYLSSTAGRVPALVIVVAASAILKPSKNVRDKFAALRNEWKAQRGPTSSTTEMSMHPAYQQIIGMGPAVVPLLLRELETNPDHWFWALKSITGADPTLPDSKGRLKQMAAAWLQWGRQQSLAW